MVQVFSLAAQVVQAEVAVERTLMMGATQGRVAEQGLQDKVMQALLVLAQLVVKVRAVVEEELVA